MKEKGFSLIELLAVIVILSIAALISVPLITGIINDSKLNGLKDSAYGILKSANLYFSQYEPETNIRFDIEENQVTSKDAEEMIQYKGYVKEGAVIVNATGKITMCITDGKNSVYKNYKDKSIVVVENDSCYIPENQAIVYLANGGATLDELDNQELTDLVTSLQEEINSLKTAKEAQSNLIATLQGKVNTLETGISSKVDQNDINTINGNISTLSNQLATKANQSDINAINNNMSMMSTQIETIGTIANSSTLDKAYPVGSIYISVKNTNPSTLFGGTWVAFGTGRTLVGVDTNQSAFNTVEKTGGSNAVSYTPSGTVNPHQLTINEMPSHTHTINANASFTIANNQGSGTSGIPSASGSWGSYKPAHWYTLSNEYTGGSQAHSHTFTGTGANISTLQPYITVYMWKRTA